MEFYSSAIDDTEAVNHKTQIFVGTINSLPDALVIYTGNKILPFNPKLTHRKALVLCYIKLLWLAYKKHKYKHNHLKYTISKEKCLGGGQVLMKLYQLIKSIDPMILLCSEKREFKAFGYNYIEHYWYSNIRILENTDIGTYVEFYSPVIQTADEIDTHRIPLTGKIAEFKDIIWVNANKQNLYFNTKLTKQKSKTEMALRELWQVLR